MLEAKWGWQWLVLELWVQLYLQHGSGSSPAPYAAGIMGLAGAGLGFGAGREFAGLKAWQGHINSKISAVNAKRGADATKRNLLSGGDNAWKYAKNRFNSMGG